MPYHIYVQREYVYHTTPRKDNSEKERQTEPTRTTPPPTQEVPVSNYKVKVNIGNFTEDD